MFPFFPSSHFDSPGSLGPVFKILPAILPFPTHSSTAEKDIFKGSLLKCVCVCGGKHRFLIFINPVKTGKGVHWILAFLFVLN